MTCQPGKSESEMQCKGDTATFATLIGMVADIQKRLFNKNERE